MRKCTAFCTKCRRTTAAKFLNPTSSHPQVTRAIMHQTKAIVELSLDHIDYPTSQEPKESRISPCHQAPSQSFYFMHKFRTMSRVWSRGGRIRVVHSSRLKERDDTTRPVIHYSFSGPVRLSQPSYPLIALYSVTIGHFICRFRHLRLPWWKLGGSSRRRSSGPAIVLRLCWGFFPCEYSMSGPEKGKVRVLYAATYR